MTIEYPLRNHNASHYQLIHLKSPSISRYIIQTRTDPRQPIKFPVYLPSLPDPEERRSGNRQHINNSRERLFPKKKTSPSIGKASLLKSLILDDYLCIKPNAQISDALPLKVQLTRSMREETVGGYRLRPKRNISPFVIAMFHT
ncbi:hypothetical protein TNIN_232891 [Trichonephila inaurata madagascariensis]|uniref:Uncharacterized protein n=1 Tax=Trichonephila inaurata madagascariensis TaxID=2747483 RepID=A0A8X6XBI1_9ARAC|nr:hypothetical protein TNIN_232891 [Trichonephila inaurata madagascariensis]